MRDKVGYICVSGNRGYQLPSRNFLNDFPGDALPISGGSLLKNGVAEAGKISLLV